MTEDELNLFGSLNECSTRLKYAILPDIAAICRQKNLAKRS